LFGIWTVADPMKAGKPATACSLGWRAGKTNTEWTVIRQGQWKAREVIQALMAKIFQHIDWNSSFKISMRKRGRD